MQVVHADGVVSGEGIEAFFARHIDQQARATIGGMIAASHLRGPQLPPHWPSVKPLYQRSSSPSVAWHKASICVPTLSVRNRAQLCQAVPKGCLAKGRSCCRLMPSGVRNEMISRSYGRAT